MHGIYVPCPEIIQEKWLHKTYCIFYWSYKITKIFPAIFGSSFQVVDSPIRNESGKGTTHANKSQNPAF